MAKKQKIIVVGINHAGTSTIRTLLGQNKDADVVAYDRNTNISFLGCGIALTVNGTVKHTEDLFYCNAMKLKEMGAKINMFHDVTEIDRKKKTVTVKDLKTNKVITDTYDKLVYAAGSWPIDLKIPNNNLEGVEICKLYQHALKLIDEANDPKIKSVAVIGAGYIGIELAEAYHMKGKKVYLIDAQSRIVPRYFDTDFTNELQDEIRKEGVELILNSKVKGYQGKDGHLTAVETDNGVHKVDLAIECIGFLPNTDILKGVDKLPKGPGCGSVIVNSAMQSSDPDVYVIGDSAAVYNAASQKHQNVSLATNAVKTGLVAASQINGATTVKLESVVGTNAICVFGQKLTSTGMSEEEAIKQGFKVKSVCIEDNDRPEWMNIFSKVKIKLVYDEKTLRLIGAQIGSYGDGNHTETIFYLALAIQKSMSLVEVALTDVYFLPHLNKPFNFVLTAILKAIGLEYK